MLRFFFLKESVEHCFDPWDIQVQLIRPRPILPKLKSLAKYVAKLLCIDIENFDQNFFFWITWIRSSTDCSPDLSSSALLEEE